MSSVTKRAFPVVGMEAAIRIVPPSAESDALDAAEAEAALDPEEDVPASPVDPHPARSPAAVAKTITVERILFFIMLLSFLLYILPAFLSEENHVCIFLRKLYFVLNLILQKSLSFDDYSLLSFPVFRFKRIDLFLFRIHFSKDSFYGILTLTDNSSLACVLPVYCRYIHLLLDILSGY